MPHQHAETFVLFVILIFSLNYDKQKSTAIQYDAHI